MRLVKHGLEECEFKNTCNNDKSLSEIQLKHEKDDELVVVVVKVVHEYCMMVMKEIEDGLLEEMEKFGWWFEKDIDGESEDDNEKKLVMGSRVENKDATVSNHGKLQGKKDDDGLNELNDDTRSATARCDGSPKVGSGCINLDGKGTTRRVNRIDVTATFEVPLRTVGDLHKLINDIEAGKHDELLSEMTYDDRMETMDAIGTICKSIRANNNNADVIPCKVLNVDDSINLIVDEFTIPSDPIVQSVDINTKSTSYAGATGISAKDQPKVNSNFHTLVADPVFDGVNIYIPRKVVEKVSTRFEHTLYGYFIGKRMAFLVVEYYARNNWTKHGMKRIMMNSKGFFIFKFDSWAGLEAVLEGGPWLICKSSFILKKWSMDTRLIKEELTRIPIWVKLHDVPIHVFKEDDVDLVDVVTIGIPSLSGEGFTKETIRVDPPIVNTSNVVNPTVEKTNDGFQTVGKKKKRKSKSKSTNGGQFVGPSIKQNIRYEPKATTSAPKKGVTNVGNTSQSAPMLKTTGYSFKKDNLSMSNSFSALNDDEKDDEEDVQSVYDESANLLQNTKAGGSSSFTATAG
ncbi:zinc knuckle CX2CX4HX4C containing protein [Tanacetum coccineum]